MPKSRRKLTDQQRRLVDYYFGVSNFNKTDALRRAGYGSPNDNHKVFDGLAVGEEIERRHALVRERYEVTYERVVAELARVAFSSPLDYMEPQEDGTFLIDLRKTSADEVRAIGELKVEYYTEGRGEDAREVKRVTLKPWNKTQALDLLARHAGLSREKSPLEGAEGLIERIMAGRRRVAASEEEE